MMSPAACSDHRSWVAGLKPGRGERQHMHGPNLPSAAETSSFSWLTVGC